VLFEPLPCVLNALPIVFDLTTLITDKFVEGSILRPLGLCRASVEVRDPE
jgi:hypothetical protein